LWDFNIVENQGDKYGALIVRALANEKETWIVYKVVLRLYDPNR